MSIADTSSEKPEDKMPDENPGSSGAEKKEETNDKSEKSPDDPANEESSNIKKESAANAFLLPLTIDSEKYISLTIGGGEPSGVKVEDPEDVYKRKGFYHALTATLALNAVSGPVIHEDPVLLALLSEHQGHILERLTRSEQRFTEIREHLAEQIRYWRERLEEKRKFKQEYRELLTKRIESCEDIQAKIEEGIRELTDLSKRIGKEKDELIDKRIMQLRKEIEGIVSIYQDLEKKQNDKFTEEFNKNRGYFQSKVDSLEKLKQHCQAALDDVRDRIKALSQVGINIPVANILIGIGFVCAFVAGWFFSIWSGDDATMTPGTMGDNKNLRFFFIDNLGKLASQHSFLELVVGLFAYILIIGGVSYCCYRLLHKGKFTKKKKAGGKPDEEGAGKEEVLFDVEDEDKLMKSSFRANDWYSFWLKITPFIVTVFLTLVVLSRNAYRVEPAAGSQPGKTVNEFQGLMDSYSNQALGTLMAFLVAGLFILYIARVVEPKYVKEHGGVTRAGNWEIVLSISLFLLMVGLMVVYKCSAYFSGKVGIIAISGFVVGCLATGLILGYGYRFRALQDLASMLEYDLAVYDYKIHLYSSPYRVSYLKFGQFHANMLAIQLTIQNLIQNRNVTANELTNLQKGEKPAGPAAQQQEQPRQEPEEKPAPPRTFLVWFNHRVVGVVRQLFVKKKDRPDVAPKSESTLHILSDAEALYFPVYSKEAELIYQKLEILSDKIRSIEAEADAMYRNEKTWRSLNSQAEEAERVIYRLNQADEEVVEERSRERDRILLTGNKEKNLLSEGYITGVWYRQVMQ